MGVRFYDDGDPSPAANGLTAAQACAISGWSAESLLRSVNDGSVGALRVNGAVMIDGRSLARAMRPRDRHRVEWSAAAQERFEAEQRELGMWTEPDPTQPETPRDARHTSPLDLYRRDFLGGIH
jgi:hypothetical protein